MVQSAVQSHSHETSQDDVKPTTPNAKKKQTPDDDEAGNKSQGQTDVTAQVQVQQQVIPAAPLPTVAELLANLPVQTVKTTDANSQNDGVKQIGASQPAQPQQIGSAVMTNVVAQTANVAALTTASNAVLATNAAPVAKVDGQTKNVAVQTKNVAAQTNAAPQTDAGVQTTDAQDPKQTAALDFAAIVTAAGLPLAQVSDSDHNAAAVNAQHAAPVVASGDQQDKSAVPAHKDSASSTAQASTAQQQQTPTASQVSVPTPQVLHTNFASQSLTQAFHALERVMTPSANGANTKLPAADATAAKSTDASSAVQSAPAHTKPVEHSNADNASSSNSGQSDKGNQNAGNGATPAAAPADSIRPQVASAVDGIAVNVAPKAGDAHVQAGDAAKQAAAPVAAQPTMVQGTAGDEVRTSSINTARLMQSVNETGMRIGVQSADYGNIAIHTLMDKGGITSQISVEHADLAKAIAAGLPELHTALGGHDQLEVKVAMHGQLGAQMDMNQRGGGDGRGEARRNTQTFANAMGESQGVAPEIEVAPAAYRVASMTGNTGRLDVRI